MMATVQHVTAWAGRTKYRTDGFLFDWVYITLFEKQRITRMQGFLYVVRKHISDSILHAPAKRNH